MRTRLYRRMFLACVGGLGSAEPAMAAYYSDCETGEAPPSYAVFDCSHVDYEYICYEYDDLGMGTTSVLCQLTASGDSEGGEIWLESDFGGYATPGYTLLSAWGHDGTGEACAFEEEVGVWWQIHVFGSSFADRPAAEALATLSCGHPPATSALPTCRPKA